MAATQEAFSTLLASLGQQLGASSHTHTPAALATLDAVRTLAEHVRRQNECVNVSRAMSVENTLEGLFHAASSGLASAFMCEGTHAHVFMSAGETLHDVSTAEGVAAYVTALAHTHARALAGRDRSSSPHTDPASLTSAEGAASGAFTAPIPEDASAAAPSPPGDASVTAAQGVAVAGAEAVTGLASPPAAASGPIPSARAGMPPLAPTSKHATAGTAPVDTPQALPAPPGLAHAASTTGTVLASSGTEDSLPHIALRRISQGVSGSTAPSASPMQRSARRSTSAMSTESLSLDGGTAVTFETAPLFDIVPAGSSEVNANALAIRVMKVRRPIVLTQPLGDVTSGPQESAVVSADSPSETLPAVTAGAPRPGSAARPNTPSKMLPALQTPHSRKSVPGPSSPVLVMTSPQTNVRMAKPPAGADPHVASNVSLLTTRDSAVTLAATSSTVTLPALPASSISLQQRTSETMPISMPRLLQKQSTGYSHATLVPEPDHGGVLSPTITATDSFVVSNAGRSDFSPPDTVSSRDIVSGRTVTGSRVPGWLSSPIGSPNILAAVPESDALGFHGFTGRSAADSSPHAAEAAAAAKRPAAAVAAPIIANDGDGAVLGVLVLRSPTIRLTARDLDLIEIVSSALVAGRRRISAVEEALAAEKRAFGLVQMVKAVSHEVEVPQIIVRIIDVAYDLLSADRVSVFRVDAERRELVLSVSEDAAGLHMPMDKGIVGRVATTGDLLNIPDAYDSPLFDRSFDQRTNYRTRSVLCMPVKAPGGDVVAVIQAINKAGGLPFTAEDERTLSVVADTAGVTLHKARLLSDAELARRASAALADVVRIVNDSEDSENENVEALLQSLVDVAYRVVDADRITLFMVDALKQELFCHVSQDAEGLRRLRIPLGVGIAGTVAAQGFVVNIADAYADARFNRDMDTKSGYRTRSILCMPLKLRQSGRVVGVVQAINKRGGPFTRVDEELLEAWATEVGLVIDRKSLQLAYDKVLEDEMSEGNADAGKLSSFLTQFVKVSAPAASRPGRGSIVMGVATGVTSRKMSGGSTPLGAPSMASMSSFSSARQHIASTDRAMSQRHMTTGIPPNHPIAVLRSASGAVSPPNIAMTAPHSPSMAAPSAAPPVLFVPTAGLPGTDAASAPAPSASSDVAVASQRSDDASSATKAPAAIEGEAVPQPASPPQVTSTSTPAQVSAAASTPTRAAATSANVAEAATSSPASSTAAGSVSVSGTPAAAAPTAAPATGGVLSARMDSPTSDILSEADAEMALLRPWMLQVARPGRADIAARMTKWDFDVLEFEDVDLETVMLDMTHHFDLLREFRLDVAALSTFFSAVRSNYRANPYHNFKHGVSVAHVCFLAMHHTAAAASVMLPLDRLAVLLAGLCHDIDHPGVTNAFEMNALTDFAVLYNDQSVLENHHAALMFQLLRSQETFSRGRVLSDSREASATQRRMSAESAVSGGSSIRQDASNVSGELGLSILGLPRADFMSFRRTAIAGILATDMTHHNSLTDQVRKLNPDNAHEVSAKTLAELLIHSADLANPVLPSFPTVHRWAMMVCQEFSAQVTREKSLGLPFAPHMDGLTTPQAIAKLQVGFIGYVVSPLWTSMAGAFPELQSAVDNMTRNRAQWQGIADGSITYPAPLAGAAAALDTASTTTPAPVAGASAGAT